MVRRLDRQLFTCWRLRCRSLTRRPTNGGAPAASAPGSLATAVARLLSAAGPAAAASTAAAITSRGSDPSTAATRVTTVSRRHDGQNGRRALASSWPAGQHATATCGLRPPEPAPGGVAVLAAVPAAGSGAGPSPGSMSSPGPQPRMSHSAASVARLSRSGVLVTSR